MAGCVKYNNLANSSIAGNLIYMYTMAVYLKKY